LDQSWALANPQIQTGQRLRAAQTPSVFPLFFEFPRLAVQTNSVSDRWDGVSLPEGFILFVIPRVVVDLVAPNPNRQHPGQRLHFTEAALR